jgi:hypothetical protein
MDVRELGHDRIGRSVCTGVIQQMDVELQGRAGLSAQTSQAVERVAAAIMTGQNHGNPGLDDMHGRASQRTIA